MRLHITPRHFEFARVGNTLEECFQLKADFELEAEAYTISFKSKDISKAERKAIKKPVLIDDDNDE
jgi:hypothetical protein